MVRRQSIGSLAALVLAGAAAADDQAGPLSTCRSIGAAAARLACYDSRADRPVASPSPSPLPAPAPAPPPAAAAAELFGRDAVQSGDIARRAAGIEQIDEIRARVTGARPDPYGKLTVTLDNGQVWAQIDSPALKLKPGDEVRIRRAAMGSYLLTAVDGRRSSRVRRSR